MQHSKITCGIDIGTSKITTIVGQYLDTEDRLNIVAVSSTPSLGFRKGQIVNIELAQKTILQSVEAAERMAGFQINSADVAISAPYIESLNSKGIVAVSNTSGEIEAIDIERAIEAAKSIPLPAGKEIIHVIPRIFTVDGQEGIVDPIGMNGVRLEVEAHIILASTPSIKNLKKCLDETGINTDSIVYSGLVTAKAAITETEKELGVALVDIGGSNTSITIFSEGSPIFSSVVPIGASNITNDLAIGLRMSIEDAEAIKLKLSKNLEGKKFEDETELSHFGITSDPKRKISTQTAINGIIKPRLEEIFTFIRDQIEKSGFSKIIPAGLVLTGGGCQTINTKEICAKLIPAPLRIAQPQNIGGIVDEVLNPGYTSSIGLLLYSLQNNHKENKKNSSQKSKVSFSGLVGKVRNLLEPLLP